MATASARSRDDAASRRAAQTSARVVAAYEALVRQLSGAAATATTRCGRRRPGGARLRALRRRRGSDDRPSALLQRCWRASTRQQLAARRRTRRCARSTAARRRRVPTPADAAPTRRRSAPAPADDRTAADCDRRRAGAPPAIATIRGHPPRRCCPTSCASRIELDARSAVPRRAHRRTRGACSSICRARGRSPALLDATLRFTTTTSCGQVRLGRHPQQHDARRARPARRRRATASTRSTARTAWSSTASRAPRGGAGGRRAVPQRRRLPRACRPDGCRPPRPRRSTDCCRSRDRRPQARADASDPRPPSTPAPPLPVAPAARRRRCRPARRRRQTRTAGSRSSRQLGLGVSRIVIDAGPRRPRSRRAGQRHHRSGARARRRAAPREAAAEAAGRRSRPDAATPTSSSRCRSARRSPTAKGADLFLSIHANASANAQARGVETYFLNFATNLSAAAVAARENAASGQAMDSLPDIVKAIALNNKLDESRDFADARAARDGRAAAARRTRRCKDLGVKQAPFVVLIGAVDAERAGGDLVRDQHAGSAAAEDAAPTGSGSPKRCSTRSASTRASLKRRDVAWRAGSRATQLQSRSRSTASS